MSFINYLSREINCKIVYSGAGLSGRLSSMQLIYQQTDPASKGKMISMSNEVERFTFFDFLPNALGEVKGFKVRLHLYTIPASIFPSDQTMDALFKGVDAIIGVLDSDPSKEEYVRNAHAHRDASLQRLGLSLARIPHVWQLNKRDLPNAISVQEARRWYTNDEAPLIESCTKQKWGHWDALKVVARALLDTLKAGKYEPAHIEWSQCTQEELLALAAPGSFFTKRQRALEELFRRDPQTCIPHLYSAAKDNNAYIRAIALGLLGIHGVKQHETLFREALEDTNMFVYHKATRLMREQLGRAILPHLLEQCERTESQERAEIVLENLASLGSIEALPFLDKLNVKKWLVYYSIDDARRRILAAQNPCVPEEDFRKK